MPRALQRSSPPVRRPPRLSPELRRLIDRAYADRERDARTIVARARRLYPEYRALTGAALEGLWQNVRYLVAGFYRFNLLEGRSPTMKELAETIASAKARATQGVSLGAMIGTYQLALPILWEHLIETVGPHPEFRMELARGGPRECPGRGIGRSRFAAAPASVLMSDRRWRRRIESLTGTLVPGALRAPSMRRATMARHRRSRVLAAIAGVDGGAGLRPVTVARLPAVRAAVVLHVGRTLTT